MSLPPAAAAMIRLLERAFEALSGRCEGFGRLPYREEESRLRVQATVFACALCRQEFASFRLLDRHVCKGRAA